MRQHQLNAVNEILNRRRMLLFLKPGGGKTASTLTGIDTLRAFPALVVAPIRVCETVWAQEAQEWVHLTHLTFSLVRGTPQKRLKKLSEPAQIYLINYELLPWLMDILDGRLDTYRAVVFDEVSMMKSPGAKRFRAVRNALKDVPVRIGLTGTPTGNSLLNLFGETWTVASEEAFGGSYVRFKQEYFVPVDRDQFIWRPKHDSEERILKRINPWAVHLHVPRTSIPQITPISVTLPSKARKIYSDLSIKLTAQLNGKDIFAMGELALSGKVRQVCSGAVYLEDGSWEKVHDAKIDALSDLMEELEGAPLLIVYEYRHELERIQAKIPDVVALSNDAMKLWNTGKLKAMALHPKSGGHGLNLQHGGSNICFFTTPWSLELWTQTIGRLDRPGQSGQVSVYPLVARGTIDEDVAKALTCHAAVETRTLDAVTRQ